MREKRMSDYLESVKHGKVFTSCFESALEIRRIDKDFIFVAPFRGKMWHRRIPERSRLVKISDFDVREELAPSKKLVSSFRRKLLNIEEFEMTYALEMELEKPKQSVRELASTSLNGNTLVVFGTAKRGQPCHRYMLAKLIARDVVRISNSRHRAKVKAYAGELSP